MSTPTLPAPTLSEPTLPAPTTLDADGVNDAQLIEAILAGNRSALPLLMQRHGGAMLAAARSIAAHAADDIVQEAWIAALKALPQFEQRASLKTWLVRISMNKAYSHLRKYKNEVSLQGLSDDDDPLHDAFDRQHHWLQPWQAWPESSPDQLLEAHVLKDCLDKHIQLLPEGQRAVLLHHNFSDQNINEICNVLQVSTSNYRVLLHRARLRLHAMVSHYQETGEC